MRHLPFPDLHARVTAFHAEHNAPAAIACRALDTIREALDEMTTDDRAELRGLLVQLVAEVEWEG